MTNAFPDAQQQDDAQKLDDLEDRYRRAREDRRKYEPEWQTNLAFLKGQQWLQWSRQRQALYQPPVPPWRQRRTTNLIQPVVRTLLGKIIAQPTQTKVQAANDTVEASQDARAQDQLIDHLRVVCHSEKVEEEAARWLIATGTEIQHVCWDKSLGEEISYPDTVPGEGTDEYGEPNPDRAHPQAGEPMREPGPDGEVDPDGNVVHMGEVDHQAVSVFQFFPEPGVENLEDMEWCFLASVKPAGYVNRRYGKSFTDDTVASEEFNRHTTADDESTGGGTTKGVLLKRYWEKPNNEYPDGRYAVYANDEILFSGPNPYPHLPLPFVVGRDRTAVPGRFWGRSVIADLVPLQREYNKLKSQGAEIRESTARPKWHAFKGTLIAGRPITTAPAEVLETNPLPGLTDGGKPTKIAGGDVPASFMAEAAGISSQFYEIAGVHDFSHGVGGFRSMAALRMLIEQDDMRSGVLIREHSRTTVEAETAMLKIVKQFYIEPRAVSVVGPDQSVEVHQFFAEKIADDPQVRLITSGALPLSYAAREEVVLGWQKSGLVTDPRVIRKLLGLTNLPGIGDSLELDTRKAERENQAMKMGQPVEAHDFDNHLVHGQEHDDYRKGQEYEKLVQANPPVADVFAQHVAMHKQLIEQAMAVAPQAQAGGQPGGSSQSPMPPPTTRGMPGSPSAARSPLNAQPTDSSGIPVSTTP